MRGRDTSVHFYMDMHKNSTSGTVSASSGKVKAEITFCLVNGARKLGGTCHTSKYSAGSASADYFVTSAAIHVLNGEASLSYYNNGSKVYKNIAEMVSDAKKYDKSKYDSASGCTKSITYSISPKRTEWEQVEDGLYRTKDKLVNWMGRTGFLPPCPLPEREHCQTARGITKMYAIR